MLTAPTTAGVLRSWLPGFRNQRAFLFPPYLQYSSVDDLFLEYSGLMVCKNFMQYVPLDTI